MTEKERAEALDISNKAFHLATRAAAMKRMSMPAKEYDAWDKARSLMCAVSSDLFEMTLPDRLCAPLKGILRDVNGAIVVDYSDAAAECSECGAIVTHGLLATNPWLLDTWQDCGDEVYCPNCRSWPSDGQDPQDAPQIAHVHAERNGNGSLQ